MNNNQPKNHDAIGNQRPEGRKSQVDKGEANLEASTEDLEVKKSVAALAKERAIATKGQAVPLDLFLFSCLEQEKLADRESTADPQWLGFNQTRTELSSPYNEANLSRLVQIIMQWFRETYPSLSNEAPIELERLQDVVVPLVQLNQDLSDAYRIKCDEELPAYEKSFGNNRFWDDIEAELRNIFPKHFGYFFRYIKWSHGSQELEEFEVGDRPPVGRYAPRYSQRNAGAGRGPSGGGNSRGGAPNRSRPPRGGGEDRDRRPSGRRAAGGGEDRDRGPGGGHRPSGGGRPSHNQGQSQDRGRFNKRRGPRNGPPENQTIAEQQSLEAGAIADVEIALEKLSSDPTLEFVQLKPTNSFYRRIQHQRIVDAGYNSQSVGEGHDRAVRIVRT